VIFLNVHAPTRDKWCDTKDSIYEELDRAFDQVHKYYMNIFLIDYNAKV
jgi:hypothetical protein